jgi:hypothetical protein
MRLFQRSHPAFLILALALGISLLGDLPRRPANAETAIVVDELLQVSVGGAGGDQTLFTVNTTERKIFVYRLDQNNIGHLMLNAYRDYKYDLFLDEWPPKASASPLSAQAVSKLIQQNSADYKNDRKENKVKDVDEFVKKWLKDSKGQTLLTTVFPQAGGNRTTKDLVYLTDKANKKILVYTMENNTLTLLAVRKYSYDEYLPWSGNLAAFIPFSEMKKKWEEEKKKEEEEKKKEKD